MKEFDIELAKQGKPVCTRDGRKARILCFDFHISPNDTKILCAIESSGCKYIENTIFVDDRGCFTEGYENPLDIMMATEKHEGWVNIYKNPYVYHTEGLIYETEEGARKMGRPQSDYLTTTKIEWEE